MLSIVLGIIGVGGLVYQWATSKIDEYFKMLEDLKDRVATLESAGTTTTTTTTNTCTCDTTQLNTDLAAVKTTADAACAKVSNFYNQIW